MKYNRWAGDPAVKLTPDGAKMLFIGGEPVRDAGLENAAQISICTKPNWWGNALISDPNQQIGSDCETIRVVVDKQTIIDDEDAVKRALQWMQDTGIASKIEITITNPAMNYIKREIKIYPPNGDVYQLLLLNNGINWINQAQNPAHERLKNV